MIESIRNAFKIPELKKRILFTLGMIAIYRLGTHIPTPGVNIEKLSSMFDRGGVLGFLDLFSGGALSRFSLFALGIAPYINASIIMQLLVYVIPYLERLSKEGEEGRKKISQFTRYGTVIIGALQAFGITFMLQRQGVVLPGLQFWQFTSIVVLSLTAGSAFLMWLGEQMTDRGVGNGISLLIFAGIVSRLPAAVIKIYAQFKGEPYFVPKLLLMGIGAVLIVAGVVYIYEGQRKIPVQYAKRVVGRKIYGGQSTHIPLRVNQAGVIPVIFAMSILMFPGMIANMFMSRFESSSTIYWFCEKVGVFLQPPHIVYYSLYCAMIIFFSYFYTAITFNPKDVADNMKKWGGFIPGIRAGRPTSEFIDRTLVRITLAGSIFLAVIAIMPSILIYVFKVPFYFGGTALLIVVGVALDTVKQMEAHMVTRHYEG
ncbi:MAG: preprotein translocase subunit SecY, partial [bacterium]|nr:preprotein translocase subunit SecY [bacterium]